jgi:hypothetical protein
MPIVENNYYIYKEINLKDKVMKTTILLLFLALTSCSKDSVKQDPIAQLPPETQTGANTFGVTINGKVYIPRDPTGINWGGQQGKGMVWWGTSTNQFKELVIVDGASSVGFKITLHIQHLEQNGVGQYTLKQSNFQNQIESISENHVFFKIWDTNINNYAYYGSVENQGVINITRHDTINYITSGNFSGKFVRYDNPNEYIQITDGRFDTGANLLNTPFP